MRDALRWSGRTGGLIGAPGRGARVWARMRRRGALRAAVCAGAGATLVGGGCAAVPVATVATASAAAGAAAGAAEFSSAVYRLGKVRAAEMATVERLREAVRAAAGDLSLEIEAERDNGVARGGSDGVEPGAGGEEGARGPSRVTFVLADEQGDRVVIKIYRQTETLSLLVIDVGLFGPQHLARLVYERIQLSLGRSMGDGAGSG